MTNLIIGIVIGLLTVPLIKGLLRLLVNWAEIELRGFDD